eukprot:Tamp_19138.p2 GENE.Tamp_19138~~Tamp_19138.p2  ORF type:complete len:399 (+),score=167.15 Tamp_19138:66-1199(+)
MIEDTLCTAIRGGDGSCTVGVQVANTPMARSSLEASLDQPASWHIKVVTRASIKGKIYVGVETVENKGTVAMLIGTDWFHEACVSSAVFYSSDGDICRGNQIVMSTGMGYGDGDVIGIQIVDRQLMFLKNGEPVGEPLSDLRQWVRAAGQMHRPGDKLLLLRELAGPAAGKDIARTKVLKEEKKKAEEEAIRRREEAKLAHEAELRRREEAKKEAAQRALEEERKRAEEEERRKQEEALERERAAELERLRKERLEEEKRRLAELRRAKQAKEEAARKKAAEEQIKKVARSRGGYFEEETDPDAPDEAEIQEFMRNCLPLRLTAARQMGMVALPVASKVASMKVMLTPQQHYAVKKHLTEVKRAKKKAQQAEVETLK